MGNGSVAEWWKAHGSKSCGSARFSEVRSLSLPPLVLKSVSFGFGPSVRILSLPPETKEESLLSYFVSEGSRGDSISSRFRQQFPESVSFGFGPSVRILSLPPAMNDKRARALIFLCKRGG